MLLTVLILVAAPAIDSATCGATKFTLNKPAQAQAPAKAKVEAPPKPKPKIEVAKAKPKTKPLADCDKPKRG